MKTKICAKCKLTKKLEDFQKDKTLKGDGYRSYCRICQRLKCKLDSRKRYKNGKRKQYNKLNSEHISLYSKVWRKNNRKLISKKTNIKYNSDINFKLKHVLRSRIQRALILGCKKTSSSELLGCNIEEYKIYLQSLFVEGMSWENYGRKGWHIDHIKPCSKFDLTKEEEQKKCFHYSNTQPLWWKDNLIKHSSYETRKKRKT